MTEAPFLIAHYSPFLFIFVFIAAWIVVVILLGGTSGWFKLAHLYPDRKEAPLHVFRGHSGRLGTVSMRGILTFSVCPSGLRVSINPLFGPFYRNFFVPWQVMKVTRYDRVIWRTAKLSFGNPPDGTLSLFAYTANRLARAAGKSWPEAGPFLPEAVEQVLHDVFLQWILATGVAAAFFTVAPRLLASAAEPPSITASIVFPAIVFGIFSAVRFFIRLRE